ncbi:MAG: HAD family phosphatase [Cyanobacteria bacterium M_surface_7_m2_040]|nr:HAD family phosphatase [Cyanobacteria bacterium M_surface_7_m2_040]
MDAPAACLFDLDGLLLDTEPLHSEAWMQAARHFGLALTPDQLLALRGRRRFDCAEQVRQWIAAAGLGVPSLEALLAVRQPIAEVLLPQALPMPGAPELLARCQGQAIPMALVTSSSRSAVALKALPHPWLAAIALRVHGDDPELVAGKPEPDPYRLAARRLGVDPRSCWAFEDSLAGACSAAAAGCRVHVLLPRDRPAQDSMALAWPPGSHLVQSLAEIHFDGRTPAGVRLSGQDCH